MRSRFWRSWARGLGANCARPAFALLALCGRRVCRVGGEPPDLPYPGIVWRIKPTLGVTPSERDQLIQELAREEQIAEQLAVDRAVLGVDDPPKQREVAIAHETADARVATL